MRGQVTLLLAQVFYPFSKSMLNRKMVFRVTKSQSMKDKISFIWYHMTILRWGGVWGGGLVGWGGGGAIYIVFSGGLSENEWKTSTKEITKCRGKFFWRVTAKKKKFLLLKRSRGHILTKERHRETPGTPRKSGFSDWKRPKEGERVALGHFHERVGESPRSYANFGTSGSKKSRFVSEIWPFEVEIAVRPNFT